MMSETQIKDLQEKIDLLNRQAWELRVSDSPTAHLLSKEAFVKAEELGYEKGRQKDTGLMLLPLSGSPVTRKHWFMQKKPLHYLKR